MGMTDFASSVVDERRENLLAHVGV